jgi:hypothetical protein
MNTYLQNQKIKFSYNSKLISWKLIHNLLNSARKRKKEGPLAMHLIGASLKLTFPNFTINDTIYDSSGNSNILFDYIIGDTAFNVIITPFSFVYEKCKLVIEKGMKAYILVPDRFLNGAKHNAETTMLGKISVQSIESFVSQNIEELSDFSKDRLAHGFYRLLKTYNDRVDAIEIDKSMLVEIPRNLAKYADK